MSNGLYTPNCIRTYLGKQFVNVLDPDPRTILIEDIAWSLAGQCRFNSHLPYHYSVAQHCILASYLVSKENALQALMHDASEAYLTDVAKPVKNCLTNYQDIEEYMMSAIALKFDIGWPLHDEVHFIDRLLLEMEYNVVMLGIPYSHPHLGPDAHVIDMGGWDRDTAYVTFLQRFKQLKYAR